ncbi:HAMP domain-containing sensor histidine kinase [Caballeronia sp. LZ029]|uniref:sensor histidine kinase n=1 Tax=Caballeronia sp. LZ029 TaxID=3038564 RepID=UPI002862DA05|nr:HAMP domain-containing sensor histidine kinase [Caballeronia sp. LZ029]MDR5748982.1 HAMP domain-containing sensor histidine kinase [Caballeronia sp. LZ029]
MLAQMSLRRRLEVSLACTALLAGLLVGVGAFSILCSLPTDYHWNQPIAVPKDVPKRGGPGDVAGFSLPGASSDAPMQNSRGRDALSHAGGPGQTVFEEAGIGATAEIAAVSGIFGLILSAGFAMVNIIIVRRCLRPLDRLMLHIAQIETEDSLHPVYTEAMPSDLRPFLESMRRLSKRLSSRKEAEKRFLANAAHMLRTPVAALQLQVANLLNAPAGQRVERARELQQGVSRLALLISRLLVLARADVGPAHTLDKVSVAELVQQVVSSLLPLAFNRNVDLGAERLERLVISASEADLEIVVGNIVDNAIRYGGSGGRVDVNVFREGDQAVIDIIDEGPGILGEELERAFVGFQASGTPPEVAIGLGLMVAKRLTESYGGRLTVGDRADGKTGTVVRITFPIAVVGLT